MYEVRVETEFAAAHFLSNYNGKCENLHGHNYRVRVFAKGESLDAGGMLLDFAILKNAVKDVCGTLDHTNLNEVVQFQNDPSAERIAKFIFTGVAKEMQCAVTRGEAKEKNENFFLHAVEVFETPTSMARFTAE